MASIVGDSSSSCTLRVARRFPLSTIASSVTKDDGLEIVKNTSCQASPVGRARS